MKLPWTRAAELRALVDEVAAVDWTDPGWWALIGAATAAETFAALRGGPAASYLSSDAEPSGDTFMGWPAPPPTSLAAAIADAIADAVAAAAALDELDGTLPDQPLRVAIESSAGAARVVAAEPAMVRFAVAGHRHAASIAGDLPALARHLATLTRSPAPAPGPAPRCSIAATIGDHDPVIARHLHRRAWTDAGGPWLGIGRAGALAVASTCHLVVDGFGHALIATRIAAARSRDAPLRARLTTAAAEIVGRAPVPPSRPMAGTAPLGVAWRRLDGPLPRFATLAHALGGVLWDEAGDPNAPHSPVLQIPVARGAKDDPLRLRRRVVTALLSLRFTDGAAEPLDAFAARTRAAIAREVDGGGLLSRLLAATAALPLPLALKRRGIVGTRSRRFAGPIEVLAGRASLSQLRLDAADARAAPPLIAVSAPGLMLPPDAAHSSSVVTIVADDRGATITVAGTGRTADPAGATALLDRWLARANVTPLTARTPKKGA